MITIIMQPMPRHKKCGCRFLSFIGLCAAEDLYLLMRTSNHLLTARFFQGFYDLVIPGAAAKVAGDGLLDLTAGGVGLFFK